MKKLAIALLAAFAAASPAIAKVADLQSGYYRVSNHQTGRYIYVEDNKGALDYHKASADMAAILLRQNLDKAVSEPASVLYIERHGDKYDIKGQNTGIYAMIGTYVNIITSPRASGAYWAYGSKSGTSMYLYDKFNNFTREVSYLDTTGADECRNWDITPIDNSTDNYFGVAPDFEADGKYYEPFYADFPFSFAAEGMKAYYIYKVDEAHEVAVIKEISGTVPALTPVIIECSSTIPADNKLNLGGAASLISGNQAKGVLFDLHAYKHDNYVTYNAATMRCLGVTAEGKLGIVTPDYQDVPGNTFYVPVSTNAPASLRIVDEKEYQEILSNGINDIINDAPASSDVYTITGVKVDAARIDNLAPGLYIINRQKVYIK